VDSSTSSGSRPGPRVSRVVSSIVKPSLLTLSARVQDRREAGADIIDLATSNLEFPTPRHILDAAAAACAEPRFFGYTPVPGLPELREAIADKTNRSSSYNVQSSQVLVTNGVEQSIFQACTTLLDPGDEVLLPVPYRASYPEAISLANGIRVEVRAGENEYPPGLDAIEEARTERSKILMLCSPSDPTGALYTADKARAIGQWAVQHGIWVVADETYADLVYGNIEYASLPAFVPALANQCVLVGGPSQVYAMNNWRVAWMIGPLDVVAAATSMQSHMTSNVFNVSQAAALAAVSEDFPELTKRHALLNDRRKAMTMMLDEIPGVTCREPLGAIFCFPSVLGVLDREIRNRRPTSSWELAELILDEVDVAVAPGEAFGAPGYLRLNYAVEEDAMIAGISRIAELLSDAR
jgi:aspartate aminotransferase